MLQARNQMSHTYDVVVEVYRRLTGFAVVLRRGVATLARVR